MIRTIFFDVGEVLVDETRLWTLWADWLDVPRAIFFAALGATIARGEHHRQVFNVVRPDLAPFDVDEARRARDAAGIPQDVFAPEDLYPDAVPCLLALRERGYGVGLAGNQPARAEAVLRDMGVPADVIASSERWGAEKPSPAFFARIAEVAGLPSRELAYVGDRIDNDVQPAAAAGMVSIFLRRGPWATIQLSTMANISAHLTVATLDQLPDALDRIRGK